MIHCATRPLRGSVVLGAHRHHQFGLTIVCAHDRWLWVISPGLCLRWLFNFYFSVITLIVVFIEINKEYCLVVALPWRLSRLSDCVCFLPRTTDQWWISGNGRREASFDATRLPVGQRCQSLATAAFPLCLVACKQPNTCTIVYFVQFTTMPISRNRHSSPHKNTSQLII